MAAKAERHATANWQGNLPQGSGTVSFGSGAISEQALTWASRTEAPGGKTSPEELLAGAQAGCYAMAFAHTLAQNGTPAESLTVNTTCTFEPQRTGGYKVSDMEINVTGKVPGLDEARFEQLAQQAEQGCPVTNAIRNNVNIHLSAHLAQ
ncbi:MAG TPA: OsmC family peroxiredoxin [Ktedonobacteraceae bacterium]|nr:OsmC family peroxiredoxin [Ktedonobacteraceae bacterium]